MFPSAATDEVVTEMGNQSQGGRVGRGGGRTRGQSSDQGNGRIDGQGGQGSEVNDSVDRVPNFSTIIAQQFHNLLPTIVAQVGDQGRGQGNGRNQNDDAINDNIWGDGVVLTWWKSQIHTRGREAVIGMSLEDFKTLTREEFCLSNKMQKLETELWNHAMIGAGHAAYTDRFHELARLVPHLVTSKGKRIERNGSIKKNPGKRGNGEEPSKDRNVKDDNKRTRTINAFATTADPVRVVPRNVNPINARNPTVRACYECGNTDHIKSACPSWSFYVIIGMDCLSDPKAKIICHEKVVRIPLLNGKVLRVLGKKLKEKMRQLMSAKAKEKKQEEIVIVKDFSKVFLDDLSGLPHNQEIKFLIVLVPGATPVEKSTLSVGTF
ncbi:putative reverse transcriptase domain-containing protein [Tanacetum coccineum]